ncbi:PepSY domain-containing protein [Thermomonas sp.]|uniref:PepSY domain-containing protein n=1 Tax=Thermomonas sp. TaxID=1971895 RepID=UPI0035B11F75
MSRTSIALPNLLAVAILAALPVASAWAQQMPPLPRERGQDRPPPTRDSLSDAVRRVERDTRGEVLSAERIQYDGRDMHRVKVVDDQGRVRVYMQEPARAGGQPQRAKRDGDED